MNAQMNAVPSFEPFEDKGAPVGPETLSCPWCGAQDANVVTLRFCGPHDVKSLTCGRCGEAFVARLRVSVRLEACRLEPTSQVML